MNSMPMNLGLQKHIIRKIIIKSHKEQGMDYDDVIDSDWEAYLDPTLELDENIGILVEHGIIIGGKSSAKEQDEEIKFAMNDRKSKVISSITTPHYKCQLCDDFVTPVKDFMIEHLQEVHGLEDFEIPPKNPHDFTYIILDELMRLSQTKEFKHKDYIVVTNEHLWGKLLSRLGVKKDDEFAPSNQKPRQILDKLELLQKHKYQRINSIGYDNKARRIYCIYKSDLERAVYKSDFDDLKYRYEYTP